MSLLSDPQNSPKSPTNKHFELEQRPLVVTSLSKSYGKNLAVNDVSFEISPGEIFGLLGPNGAGKTSIISCIVTLEKPTAGSVKVFSQDVQTDPISAKFNMGFVPQELIHHGFFSVREILEIHSGYYGMVNNDAKIDHLLNKLGLWEHKDKKVRQLSGGMKRRLLVAKALVHEPKLLLLDEPTAGVDIELRESLWDFVRELQKEGVSILLTTHYLEEAEQLCHRVGIINKGQLIKVGKTKELIRELTHRVVCFTVKGEEKSYHLSYTQSVAQLFDDLQLTLRDVENLVVKDGSLEGAFKHVLNQSAHKES